MIAIFWIGLIGALIGVACTWYGYRCGWKDAENYYVRTITKIDDGGNTVTITGCGEALRAGDRIVITNGRSW